MVSQNMPSHPASSIHKVFFCNSDRRKIKVLSTFPFQKILPVLPADKMQERKAEN
jgi:hypothetical protein